MSTTPALALADYQSAVDAEIIAEDRYGYESPEAALARTRTAEAALIHREAVAAARQPQVCNFCGGTTTDPDWHRQAYQHGFEPREKTS